MRRFLFLCLFAGLTLPVLAEAPKPGDRPGPEVQSQMRDLGRRLDEAMQARDLPKIEAIVDEVRTLLGPYAGVPESPEPYITPIDTAPPPLDTVIAAWDRVFRGPLATHGAVGELAQANKMELREAAYIAYMCCAAAQAGLPGTDEYVARARKELDYLIARQAESGLFPYPADPGGNAAPNVKAEVARIREAHPEWVRDGYVYYRDNVGMQFDVGCCGVAMCEGYRVTQDPRYLESAKKAARWAMEMPLATNWNYNAFSVWLLANMYHLTGTDDYLFAALDKTRFGVLPGLMPNGRWVDQHNAKQSYHFIIMRALSDLLHYMPENHPEYAAIRAKVDLAVDARVKDVLEDGVSNIDSALWGLSEIVRQQGGPAARKDALNAVVNAAIGRADLFASAAMLPAYIRCRAAEIVQTPDNQALDPVNDTVESSVALLAADTWRGRMPPDRRQALQPLSDELRRAMNAFDLDAVRVAVGKSIEAHGPYAAVPETQPQYGAPVDASMPDFDKVASLWQASFKRMQGRHAFETAPPPDGETQPGERLRVSLREARAYLQSYDANLNDRDEFLRFARMGFEYLLKTQTSTGVFGFPYDPQGTGLKATANRLVEQGRAQGLAMVEKGWIIEDLGEGGLQFDNGMVGIGLVYAYAVTGDDRYLDAAKRAGDWAAGRPLVVNWNYNSFSGYLLARLYRATGEQRYLEEATRKFKYGVLPGQMQNGRWFDQHNAKIAYHSIMMRASIDYYLALEQADDAYAADVKDCVVRGLDNLAMQIMTHGASDGDEALSTDALVLGSMTWGGHPEWEKAINVNINHITGYALPKLEQQGYPMPETTANYLLYRRVNAGDAQATEVQPALGLKRGK